MVSIWALDAHVCFAAIELQIRGVPLLTLAERIVAFLLRISGSIALLMLVGSGIFYMISNGNPQSQTKAKRMLIAALEGIIVILLSYSLLVFLDIIFTKTA